MVQSHGKLFKSTTDKSGSSILHFLEAKCDRLQLSDVNTGGRTSSPSYWICARTSGVSAGHYSRVFRSDINLSICKVAQWSSVLEQISQQSRPPFVPNHGTDDAGMVRFVRQKVRIQCT